MSLDSLKQEGDIRPIWNDIKSSVQEALWEEFAEAYTNQHDLRFLNMIDNGMYLNAFCMTAIEAQLSAFKS